MLDYSTVVTQAEFAKTYLTAPWTYTGARTDAPCHGGGPLLGAAWSASCSKLSPCPAGAYICN